MNRKEGAEVCPQIASVQSRSVGLLHEARRRRLNTREEIPPCRIYAYLGAAMASSKHREHVPRPDADSQSKSRPASTAPHISHRGVQCGARPGASSRCAIEITRSHCSLALAMAADSAQASVACVAVTTAPPAQPAPRRARPCGGSAPESAAPG